MSENERTSGGSVPEDGPQSPEEAQMNLLVAGYGDDRVGRGPENWQEVGTKYLYREGHMLVRDEYLDQVRAILGSIEIAAPVVQGVTLISFEDNALRALERIQGPQVQVEDPDPTTERQLGPGVAALDYLVSICQGGDKPGAGGGCPATEPIPVSADDPPDPAVSADCAAGKGIKVVVVDTGLDYEAATMHPWLEGVTGDPDAAVVTDPQHARRRLEPYAGHGTFIAGIVRCIAPAAEVIVKRIFSRLGATFESNLVRALNRVLDEDFPDVISMSSGTWTFNATGLLGLTVFNEMRLRHHKGIVLVVAAGNEDSRRSFWPAAAPWTISVGALAADRHSRAWFSNEVVHDS
jgi:subtilisin family serine protease